MRPPFGTGRYRHEASLSRNPCSRKIRRNGKGKARQGTQGTPGSGLRINARGDSVTMRHNASTWFAIACSMLVLYLAEFSRGLRALVCILMTGMP